MNLKDHFQIAIKNIRRRKLRSWLTTLGIVIGITAMVAMMIIGQGTENAIQEAFEQFGTDIILIQGGAEFAPPAPGEIGLSDEDIETVRGVSGVDYVLPILYDTAKVEFHSEEEYTFVGGYETENLEDFFRKTRFEIQDGRLFRDDEDTSAIIGVRVVDKMFEDEIKLKNRIKIEDKTFKVVGVMNEIGNAQDDSSIIVTMEAARDLFGEPEGASAMMAIAKPGLNLDDLAEDIKDELKDARDDENFQVYTSAQLLEQITGILGVVRSVLVGIAMIALVVGAVGIMNTMYMSVLERTKEIGIMKSIGATNKAILSIFLIESAAFGAVGGVIGTAFGVGISLFVGWIVEFLDLGIPFIIKIKPELIVFAVVFSAVVGMISGFFPARNAAKMNPVDALRYE